MLRLIEKNEVAGMPMPGYHTAYRKRAQLYTVLHWKALLQNKLISGAPNPNRLTLKILLDGKPVQGNLP